MGFRCAAALCRSDSAKKLSRYPWMSSVRWVIWPKNPEDISRWKRLVRRGGRDSTGCVDVFHVDRRTRLCSRHFDQDSIRMDNTSNSDPKYFAWNNWGMPINPRNNVVMDEKDSDGDDLPEDEAEIVYPVTRQYYAGKLKKFKNTQPICHPADHNYLKAYGPTHVNSSTQTSLTSDDIEDLLNRFRRQKCLKSEDRTNCHSRKRFC